MKTVTTFFAAAIISMFAAGSLCAQNITNTLGTGGLFYIKDASTNFFTLTQSTGLLSLNNNLSLLYTTGTDIGVINKGSDRFIHNFAPSGADGRNTFVGINSGNFTMSGSSAIASYNTGIGYNALTSLTSGSFNTAVGTDALYFNSSGGINTALGYYCLFSNTTGNYNTASGYYSLYSNSTGSYNTASGYYSLKNNTSGRNNTSSGQYSLFTNSTGEYNTASGSSSLRFNTIGTHNTAMGASSLSSNTEGNYNTALGFTAGYTITTGSNLTCLGYDALPSSATATNEITLGNSDVTSLRCAVITITSLSDARDKKNITDLNLGLDFLMKVKPRLFNWDKRAWYENGISDGSKMKEDPTAGFIAQELDEAQNTANSEWLKLVLKDNPQKLEATPGNLLPIMVKAIQELKKENEDLKLKNEKLVITIDELKINNEELKLQTKQQISLMHNRIEKYEETLNTLVMEMTKLKSENNNTLITLEEK